MKQSGVITLKEIELIFINWDELVLVSSSFNKALKVRRKNSGKENIHMISDILWQQTSQLRPYMRFCSLQSKGSILLNRKFEEDCDWADVIRRCQERPDIGGHTLTSFLLKPLQRLTKYPLLIEKLLRYTPEEHPDYQNTEEAQHAAVTLCEQVNEAAREQDNTDKLEWMQSHIECANLRERLVFNSLTNTLGPRKLIYAGVLHKTKSKREIIAFLLSDFLLLTTAGRSIGSTALSFINFERVLADVTCTMYRKPLFLSEMSVEAEGESESAFVVSCPSSSSSPLSSSSSSSSSSSPSVVDVCLSAASAKEKSKWVARVALAQKHIRDTERSQFHRTRSKENDSTIMGRVVMSVMGGVDLAASDGSLHSFCEVSLGSQVRRTEVSPSRDPKWGAAMQFQVRSLSQDVLCITVYQKGFFTPDEFLGRAEVRIQNIYENCQDRPEPYVIKLPLQEVKNGQVILKFSLLLFK